MNEHSIQTIELNVPAHRHSLRIVSNCIAGVLERLDSLSQPERTVYNIQLAVHETCTNILEHAYHQEPNGRIKLHFLLQDEPRQFVIEIVDNGRIFEPTSVPAPDLDGEQVRGYGLFIVEQLMDEVTYTPSDSSNQWRLVKQL